ncbi:MAG: HupE/UreJ family protein [Flavobacteriaceae bacterium]
METIRFYLELGVFHVLDLNGYDHVLFMVALALPYAFKSFVRLLLLATAFTVAHTLSLALAAFNLFKIDPGIIEFLIPVTIALTALYNLIVYEADSRQGSFNMQLVATVFFGLIHGFGFSNYFRMIMGAEDQKATALLGFTLGIETAQLLVISATLAFSAIANKLFSNRRPLVVRLISALILLISFKIALEAAPAGWF